MSAKNTVSVRQLELLIEFMEGHKDFALNNLNLIENSKNEDILSMWRNLAITLNSLKIGMNKTGEEWNQYWLEQTRKIRRKESNLRNYGRSIDMDGLHDVKPLTDLERRILDIVGKDPVDPASDDSDDYPLKATKVETGTCSEESENMYEVPLSETDVLEVFLPPPSVSMDASPAEEKSNNRNRPRKKRRARERLREKYRRITADPPEKTPLFNERRLAVESQVTQALIQLAANVAAVNDNLAGIRAALEAD